MAAVLGVYLRETEDLAIGKWSSETLAQTLEVSNFGVAESQALFGIISFEISDVNYGIGLFVNGKDVLTQSFVEGLEHGIEGGLIIGHGKELLDAADAYETHVLCYLHSVGAPGRDGFTACAHKAAL